MNKELKISCVCITKSGRTSFLKKSIGYFQSQTYPNTELIIVSQATQEENKQIEQFILDSKVKIKLYIVDEQMDIGTMRHTSVLLSQGEIVCQWDDDDVFGKNRLSNQYIKLLSDTNNVGSAYCSLLYYFKNDRKIFLSNWSKNETIDRKFHQGTIMFYKDAYDERVYYNPVQAGNSEDWAFAKKIVLEGNIGLINQFGDFVYVYHGSNTMELGHHKTAIDWNLKGDEETLIQNKDNIEDILNLLKEDFPISIVSNNEKIILTKN
jgi:glycosyltransferase involved in cell wall biosynthesis